MANLGEYLGAGSGITKGLWHLNGNSDDSSGNGNNGTDTDITYSQANGRFGKGAGFNGSSSYIDCGNDSSLTFYDGITISAWVKTSNPSQGDKRIVDKGKNGTTDGFVLDLYTGVRLIIAPFNISTGLNIPSNTWTLITAMYDKATGIAKIYYNETEEAKETGLTGSLSISLNSMVIGSAPDVSGKAFSGSIDEVIIENRAWTAQEIKKYYTYTKGRFGIL